MRLSKKIIIGASAIIVLVNVLFLGWVVRRHQAESQETLTEAARSFYKLIVVVRSWVAENDGVYVRHRPGLEPNPYLPVPGLVTKGGDTLFWRNPATVTRELSRLAQSMGKPVRFQLTSLEPLNPANAPDAFEREALLALTRPNDRPAGPYREITRFETIDGTRAFRYFAPVYAEESCLSCHSQGYDLGDIRGGISIIVPADGSRAGTGTLLTALLGSLAVSGAASIVLFLLIRRDVVRPLKRLEDAALEIGQGNYETEILACSENEIGDVGRAMVRMQQAIRSSVQREVQAEKLTALGQLSAGIAHEIRNPLFAIRNDLDYLQRRSARPFEDEVYREMEQGIERISSTVNAVLGYARPHAPEFGPHALADVVDRTMALMGKQLQKQGLVVRVDLPEDFPAIEMDIHQMEQVLVNLLANAMRACEGGRGEIRIAARRAGPDVELSVADSGVGMEADEIPRIFDPFFTRARDGTGLGLTITRKIIEQHNGTIGVVSEPGRGATFIIRIPLHQPVLESA